MTYRKFWLVNATGARYALYESGTGYAVNPSGLGSSRMMNTVRIGNAEVVTSAYYEMVDKSMEIYFTGKNEEIYQKYFDFVKFLSVRPLQLHYQTPNNTFDYYCDVSVATLTKTENEKDNIMTCSITLHPHTFWRTFAKNRIKTQNNAEGGKRYPLRRPYYYAQTGLSNVKVVNKGTVSAPLKIQIEGETTDPLWSLYHENGDKYGAAKFDGTFDRVIVDASDESESILLESNGAILENAYNYQDINAGRADNADVTFLSLGVGTSFLTFNLGANFGGTVTIEWWDQYVTV